MLFSFCKKVYLCRARALTAQPMRTANLLSRANFVLTNGMPNSVVDHAHLPGLYDTLDKGENNCKWNQAKSRI